MTVEPSKPLMTDVERWLEPSARPPRHTPPPSKTPEQQLLEKEQTNPKAWLAEGSADWVERTAAPIGTRDALVEGVFDAIMQEYRSSNPDAAKSSVNKVWLKDKIDAYAFPNLDQEIRHQMHERFEKAGVKVSG